MRGGDLDRRITLQKPGTVVDPVYGPQPGGWTDFATRVPAQVYDTLPGRAETHEQAAIRAERPARVRIRFLRGVTSDMRVIVHDDEGLEDTIHEISAGPAQIGRREWTEFTIKEYSNG